MSWSYLSLRYHLAAYALILGSLLGRIDILTLFSTIIYLITIFLYRKKISKTDSTLTNKYFVSPISGVIQSINSKNGVTKIKIKNRWFSPGDIIMPISGEVRHYDCQKMQANFTSSNYNEFSLIFVPNRLTRRQPFYLLSGDRATTQASIGFLLLGGEVLLNLSENYNIVVKSEERLLAGKTPIALLK